MGLEHGTLRLVSTIEEPLERKSGGSDLENRSYGCRGSAKVGSNVTDKPQWLGLHISLADSGHGLCRITKCSLLCKVVWDLTSFLTFGVGVRVESTC
jgi:hypothetical protein